MQIPFITNIPPLTTISNDSSDDHDSSLALFQPPLSLDPDVIPGFQAAKTYDEKFRRVRKILNLRWDTINDELLSIAHFYEKMEKTELPTTCLVIYGIEIDSEQMVACLPDEKILLNFACGVIVPDAAETHGGFAAVFGSKWFAGEWPQEITNLPITIKELFPFVLAIDIWGSLLANHKILF
ncbi:Hypothetical predicted protein [Mytilus galloprovincialis]|uniref:Uncharacterized protein n=1 Tax=Mytilus galloprovincialis TaxID=29158 RepID=A0A8B6H1T8_MYTGA|nr:Hypothetical predicted protein [Mytilus galloprovincialis]